MMGTASLWKRWLLAAAIVALPAIALGLEEQSLLTTDGTLHAVRIGSAIDLGAPDAAVGPNHLVVEWTSRAQDGTIATSLIPGTDSDNIKRGLHVAYDDQTGTLMAMWTENISAFSQIQVATLRRGVWTNTGLLPSNGISGAYNPQMLITHQTVTWLDSQNHVISGTASILQIAWWEDALDGKARLATLFLDENGFDPSALAIYDLPALAGDRGPSVYTDVPTGAYMYPALQADGLAGGVIATFADLHDQSTKVVRIVYPIDRGQPTQVGNLKWERRHIPIVGVASAGPLARMTPMLAFNVGEESAVGTSVGTGYTPTLYWLDGGNLKYVRVEGGEWTAVRTVAIDETVTYDKALGLVTGMGSRN